MIVDSKQISLRGRCAGVFYGDKNPFTLSYTVNVIACAGAARSTRGVQPRYSAAMPSFRTQSTRMIFARWNSDCPATGELLCSRVLIVSSGVLTEGAAAPAAKPTKAIFQPASGAPSCCFSRYVLNAVYVPKDAAEQILVLVEGMTHVIAWRLTSLVRRLPRCCQREAVVKTFESALLNHPSDSLWEAPILQLTPFHLP
jgi:hypothetical protein